MHKSEFFYCLIRRAYFPHELPPSFTTKYFSEFCKTNFLKLTAEFKSQGKLNTHYDTYTAPRTRNLRRHLAVVHPLGQIAVSIVIAENKSKISKLILADHSSFYRVTENKEENLAFEGLDFARWRESKNALFSEHPVVLKADISRFFYTIYSHSIPWAVYGKEKAKKLFFDNNKAFKAHWSNQLDRAIQSCQSRETFGIPVGPDTSRIVAEILMSGITRELGLPNNSSGLQSLRLVDDILVGFDNVDDAKNMLIKLRTKMWSYNLQLNESKTAIVDTRSEFMEVWQHELDSFQIGRRTISRQKSNIERLVDAALSISEKNLESTAAKIAMARIARSKLFDENFPMALDAVFRLARDYSDCMNKLVEFLMNSAATIKKINLELRVARGLKKLVKFHAQRKHDYEVVWCLLAASSFGIKWNKEDLGIESELPQPTTLAMLGLLNEKKLLEFRFSSLNWRSQVKAFGPMSQYWLPYYESVRRKWTGDKKMIASINANAVLKSMLAANVTFLEDTVLNAKHLDLKKRKFNPNKKLPFGWHSVIESDYE